MGQNDKDKFISKTAKIVEPSLYLNFKCNTTPTQSCFF